MYKTFIFTAIISLIILGYGCTSTEARQNADKPASETPPAKKEILTAVIAEQPDFHVTVPGELLPYEEVEVYAKARGFVKKIYADRGTRVRKGELLAVLEAPELAENYSSRRSAEQTAYQKYLFSKQSYERLEKAAEKSGSVAAIELERAYAWLLADSAAYAGSRAEAGASRQMTEYLKIRAPFSGVITARYASEGALLGEGAPRPVFTLAQTGRLRLTVAVPEKEMSALHPDVVAEFSLVDKPGETFKAPLSRSSQTLDKTLRSVMVEFDVENREGQLSAGQYARVKLNLKRKQPTLWVPRSAVVSAQSGSFVVASRDGKAERVVVAPGLVRDSLVEVFGDLEAGERVMVKGSEEVKEGQELR